MLQFITGPSGCGKTHRLYEQMQQLLVADSAATVYLLVPEQASFDNEKRLLAEFGAQDSQRVQVVSFTRLAELTFRDIGGITGKRMDTAASLLLMSRALAAVQDSLQVYGTHAECHLYLQELLHLLNECKQCAVTPEALNTAADTLPDGILRAKAQDLSLIFSAYEALAAQSAFIDPQDDLTVLARRLPESHRFDGAYVFIDGFKGFTGQEFAVLQGLLPRTSQMTVTLCSDGNPNTPHPATDRFFTANHTAARLRLLARECGVSVAKTVHLTENKRTADRALQALANGCFISDVAACDACGDSVRIVSCADREEECRFAARTIRCLLRENGGHCRDFTIVCRDPSLYTGILESALKREGLPYYTDKREDVLTQPLITLLESALAVITNGWDSTDILRLCKTGLVGFSAVSSALLENYAFLWKLRGSQWKQPFDKHPDGLGAETTDTSARRLDYINLLRRRLVKPLTRLQTRLGGNRNGKEFATALYQFLQELRVPRMIRFGAARLTANGEYALAEKQGRVWDLVMSLFDTFAYTLENTPLPLKTLVDLFHNAVSGMDLGTIPHTLDSVHIGFADRIRYSSPKTVIILGANEGVFPAYPAAGGILTDRERRALIRAGLPMADDADHEAAEERYYAYMALAAASERLIITYAETNNNDELFPSSLITTVQTLLPNCCIENQTAVSAVPTESAADAFDRLTSRWEENNTDTASLRQALSAHEIYRNRLQALDRTAHTLQFDQAANARDLFGTHLRLSPSQVDTYYGCRFAYFCKYGIRIRPRKNSDLNMAQAGLLTHYVMEHVLPTYVKQEWKGCTKARIEQDVADAVACYVDEYFGQDEDRGGRFLQLIRQLTRFSAELLWRVVVELRQSRFVPVDYELPIGNSHAEENDVPPWVLTTPDGSTIQVRGTVDRVDVLHRDGKSFVRVVDYKTGNKEFDLSEVLEGLNLQMLIYLFSICQESNHRYGESTPAGVLYMPAKLPVIRVSRDLSAEDVERAQLSTMRMNGLLLDDTEILEAMETDIGGLFIPASRTKRGEISSSSSLASLAQFGRLQTRVANLLTDMVKSLHQGDIAAIPTDCGYDRCSHCDYYDICGHENGDPVHTVVSRSLKEALRDLEDDEEGGAADEQATLDTGTTELH